MVLAAQGIPSLRTFILILLAMVFCRNTAMTFNRLVDVGLDTLNPRTRKRHLPSGKLTKQQAGIFLAFNAVCFIVTTYFINNLALLLSVPALFIVCFYSYTKRFTWLSHFFLGLALGISPMGAWIAVRGEFHGLPLFLGFSLLLWVSGFDIIYAIQDYEFDKSMGLYSLVTRLGIGRAITVSKVLHMVMMAVLVWTGYYWDLGRPYFFSLVITAILLLYIHYFKRSSSLDSINRDFFLANAGISFVIMAGVIISVITG
jgi:4-hydroxybenzoate polyprenyltransferase